MKVTATGLLVAAGAWGAFGQVLQSFPAPAGNPLGLAYQNGYLWCPCGSPAFTFYRLNPTNGSVVASFPSPVGAWTVGAAWNGAYLFTGDYAHDYIWRLGTTGSVYGSFAVTDDYFGGVTWDGAYLWYTGDAPPRFFRITTTGSAVSWFSIPFTPFDPGCDQTYLYCGGYNYTPLPGYKLFKANLTGSIIASAAAPGDYPRGCAHDGKDVWFTTSTPSVVYRMDDGVPDDDVAPASLGRVKAIYR
jgi:hypothetical protein